MLPIFYIFDPHADRYMRSTPTGIAWEPLKSDAEKFNQDMTAALLELPAFQHCLPEHAGTTHTQRKATSWALAISSGLRKPGTPSPAAPASPPAAITATPSA